MSKFYYVIKSQNLIKWAVNEIKNIIKNPYSCMKPAGILLKMEHSFSILCDNSDEHSNSAYFGSETDVSHFIYFNSFYLYELRSTV